VLWAHMADAAVGVSGVARSDMASITVPGPIVAASLSAGLFSTTRPAALARSLIHFGLTQLPPPVLFSTVASIARTKKTRLCVNSLRCILATLRVSWLMYLCLARTPRLLLLNLSSASLPPIPPILKYHLKNDQICLQQLQSTAQSHRIVFAVIMRLAGTRCSSRPRPPPPPPLRPAAVPPTTPVEGASAASVCIKD
jgi:hypothetical protein